MSLWFLLFLLAGVGAFAYGGVMFAFGKRRNAGLVFGAAAVLMGLSAPLGVLIGDGATATGTAPTTATALAFTYPVAGERLDAQDYLLEGTGMSGERLELLQNGTLIGQVTVGADGKWSYYVSKPTPGEYSYQLKGATASADLKLSVEQGLTTASNAQCPCRLRITPLEKQGISGSTVVLSKDGAEIARGAAPFVFENLAAGEYSFSLEAAGYKSFSDGKATLPKNKNISVYLEKQK
jgi:hypothetical protein